MFKRVTFRIKPIKSAYRLQKVYAWRLLPLVCVRVFLVAIEKLYCSEFCLKGFLLIDCSRRNG